MTIFSDSTVYQQPAQSTEEVWTALTMIISGGFKEFNSTLTRNKIQTRSSSKISQKIASPVLRALLLEEKFKVFQNPSQSTAEF